MALLLGFLYISIAFKSLACRWPKDLINALAAFLQQQRLETGKTFSTDLFHTSALPWDDMAWPINNAIRKRFSFDVSGCELVGSKSESLI